jgi:hypothetical protein
MPLFVNAAQLIRANLEQFKPDVKIHVRAVAIGTLSDAQLVTINAERGKDGLKPIVSEILFVGWHIYKSRILRDGYTIPDVIDQIESSLGGEAVVEYQTFLENPVRRKDRYGNMVQDRAILECSVRHPRPELFSVIPKGDKIKPAKQKGPTFRMTLS